MTLAGPRAWTVEEVIALCEKYADSEADVSVQKSVVLQIRTANVQLQKLCWHEIELLLSSR